MALRHTLRKVYQITHQRAAVSSILSTHQRAAVSSILSTHQRAAVSSILGNKMSTAQNGNADEYTVLTEDVLTFLDDVHKTIRHDVLEDGRKRQGRVVNFEHPKDLKKKADLEITEEGQSHERLLEAVRSHIKYSVQTGQPRFFNQQFSARDPYALAAAWVTEALNTNAHTFEVAPAFVVVERYIVEKLLGIVGYENGDGLFFPGGNSGIMAAVHLAKYRKNPEWKTKGLFGSKPLALFMSEDAHYGGKTAAAVTGIGLDNVYAVKVDARGRMSLDDLKKKVEEAKAQGKDPFFCIATCGTTVIGAFDEINPIADVCEENGMWLHADAAWGGGCLLAKNHKHLLKGIERADSFLWNAHKLMGAPLQCTVLLNKHKGLFEESNSVKAQYLYQQDKFYDVSFDIGDKSIQCGRKPDAFKLWLMWKAYGDKGMEALIERKFDNAKYFTEQLRKREGFRLCIPEYEYLNISFWYIPKSLRGQKETPEWWEKVSKVAPQIKEGMTRDGTMLIGYNPLSSHGFVNFFRLIVASIDQTHADMDFVLDEVDRLGRDL